MGEKLICLGIESSAYVFGIGIIKDNGEIIADQRATYKPEMGKGLIPNAAKNFHLENSKKILQAALNEANLTLNDIDVISYTAGPGIPPCLLVGADLAIHLAEKYKKPILAVHHGIGHIEIGRLMTNAKDPIIVYLSGGHTAIVSYVEGYYRIFGETEDISVGNCFDVVAREMGLPMPGGPEMEKIANGGKYVELPYVVKGMDVSYSGIATAAINLFKKGVPKEDIAHSFRETCFAMLTEVTERALAHTGKNEVLLVGGVAASKKLQEMMEKMCRGRGAKLYVVPPKYSGDNPIMIAWCGLLHYKYGCAPKVRDKIVPNWRIDQVPICWVK
jgi:glycoprotease/Kae1 family metallohydrolase